VKITLDLPKYFTPSQVFCSGIYFLIRDSRVVKVGKTVNIFLRVRSQEKDHKFDRIRFIPCAIDKLDYWERRWIRKLKPEYNTEKSGNLKAMTVEKRETAKIRMRKLRNTTKKKYRS